MRIVPTAAMILVSVATATPLQAQACYGLLTFEAHPTTAERERYARRGIEILSFFEKTTYRVRLRDCGSSLPQEAQGGITRLTPQDRVAASIRLKEYEEYVVTLPNGQVVNYLLNQDGTLNLTVIFHPSVPPQQIQAALGAHTLESTKESDVQWRSRATHEGLLGLAAEEIVQWIDAGPKPFMPDNDVTRAAIGADAVQLFNVGSGTVAGLGGQGVQIGIFDSGIDESHDDFGSRVTFAISARGPHGTHVAGIAAGGGNVSNAKDTWGVLNTGTAFQWHGIAPVAEIMDARSRNGDVPTVQLQYVQSGLDLSNHSYSVALNGAYDASSRTRDRLIRGDELINGRPVPPRLHVYSAGNNGTVAQYGEQIGYFSLSKQVKNGLIVGNFDIAANRISRGSSLGPAHDGRIKPDVVAPGSNITSTGFCTADEEMDCVQEDLGLNTHHDYYRAMGGTSMATPAVSGMLALVLEQYGRTYGGNLDQSPPLPSTLRGIAIHTARDIQGPVWFLAEESGRVDVQAFPGPDFVSGWGMIDAQRAVDVVQSRQIIESRLTASCDSASFSVDVSAATPLRVTLAWDDVASEPNDLVSRTAPLLVNDLDLVLVDPNGRRHRPWLLDQVARDGNEQPVPDDAQRCGMALNIARRVLPTSNPNFLTAGNPNNQNDPIAPGDLQPAGRGRDHLNNVEQVVVDNPPPGRWQVWVIGFNVAQGPQRFSLIGVSPSTP